MRLLFSGMRHDIQRMRRHYFDCGHQRCSLDFQGGIDAHLTTIICATHLFARSETESGQVLHITYSIMKVDGLVERLFINFLAKWEPWPLLCAGVDWSARQHFDGAKPNRVSLLPC